MVPSIHRHLISWSTTVCLILLAGCGAILQNHNAGELADTFYEVQKEPNAEFPSGLFENERVAEEVKASLLTRYAEFGLYQAHKRVGSNRRVTMNGQGRQETILYIFEVSCASGTTRETLTVSRNSSAEAFKIVDYLIEDIMRANDPSPAGTSST